MPLTKPARPTRRRREWRIVCQDHQSKWWDSKAIAKAMIRVIERQWGCKWPHELETRWVTDTDNELEEE